MNTIYAVVDARTHEVVDRLVPTGDKPQIEVCLVVEAPFETSIGWKWDAELKVFIQPSLPPVTIDAVGISDNIG